jgi:hypothetical protein
MEPAIVDSRDRAPSAPPDHIKPADNEECFAFYDEQDSHKGQGDPDNNRGKSIRQMPSEQLIEKGAGKSDRKSYKCSGILDDDGEGCRVLAGMNRAQGSRSTFRSLELLPTHG